MKSAIEYALTIQTGAICYCDAENPTRLCKRHKAIAEVISTALTTARQAAAQDAYERAGKLIDLCASQYPPDIWPDDSTHPAAIAARTLRVMLPKIAAKIRALAAAEAREEKEKTSND